MQLPAIVHESQISRFRYLDENVLTEGMLLARRLYKLVAVFSHDRRNEVFNQACDLSCQGAVIISTGSAKMYSLWVDIDTAVPSQLSPIHVDASVANLVRKLGRRPPKAAAIVPIKPLIPLCVAPQAVALVARLSKQPTRGLGTP